MKKCFFFLVYFLSITVMKAQNKELYYVYGVDYTHAKAYAVTESLEKFVKAFEDINMLIIREPEKYDFSRIVRKRVKVVIEPMLKIVTMGEYENLISLNEDYEEPDYTEIIKNYDIPQTEGIGIVLIAKLLNKPYEIATYELIQFDIATRDILYSREVKGEAGGFGLRNYWAASVYNVIKRTKIYK